MEIANKSSLKWAYFQTFHITSTSGWLLRTILIVIADHVPMSDHHFPIYSCILFFIHHTWMYSRHEPFKHMNHHSLFISVLHCLSSWIMPIKNLLKFMINNDYIFAHRIWKEQQILLKREMFWSIPYSIYFRIICCYSKSLLLLSWIIFPWLIIIFPIYCRILFIPIDSHLIPDFHV